ncbi:MAG: hypothetical protein ACYC5G_04330 [Candidatus Doudnabacteria bacterium]
MNAKEVEIAVVNYFGARQNLIVPNVSWGFLGLYYEADLIVITKAGYAKEVEIKVSRSDLIKDKEKKHTHDCKKFKELYFAIPEKLLKDKEHIPERAGILVCEKVKYDNDTYYRAKLERPAISNGGEPLMLEDRYELARLGTLRIWNLKRKILEITSKKI